METIKQLVNDAHVNAIEKGFYDTTKYILNEMELAISSEDDGLYAFNNIQRKAVKDAFIAQRLMLINSELGEALEANRKSKEANLNRFKDNCDRGVDFKDNFEKNIKDSFADELADAVIRIADLAGWLEIDLEWHVKMKHKYNTGREQMHGGKAY